MFKEIIAFYAEKRIIPTNKVCRQNVELMFKQVVYTVTTELQRFEFIAHTNSVAPEPEGSSPCSLEPTTGL
jgi:hypothetical protein